MSDSSVIARRARAAILPVAFAATAAFALVLLFAACARAATLEQVGTFNSPRDMRSHPTDPDRLYVAEKAGTIQMLKDGTKSLVLNMNSNGNLVGSSGNEEGLLSLALAPDFVDSGKFYVFYTTPNTSGNNNSLQIDEFTMVDNVASVQSRRPIITIPHPTNQNHNGGQLHFGPDGFLYASFGDGGGGGDPQGNGQNPTTLLGTLIRIRPVQSGSDPYTSPNTNPFAGTENDPVPGARDEIWSWGLRNPWRWSFDRFTGDLTIADVGQDVREEINFRTGPNPGRGVNFGWNCREGSIAYSGAPAGCATSPYADSWVSPVFDYPNLPPGQGSCSITGGYISRDESTPELYGRYVYGDYCTAQIRSIQLATPSASDDRPENMSVAANSLVSFGEDSCGRLYVISDPSGTNDPISRIVGTDPADCGTEVPDTDPPEVTAHLTPDEPDGNDGWFRTTPTIRFTADDGDGSGVDSIEYRIDGGDWKIYTEPEFLMVDDGEHIVDYKATDNEGNESETATLGFKLDVHAPTSSVSWQPLTGNECPDSHITGFCPMRVQMDADDGTGSGIATRYIAVVPTGDPYPDPMPEYVNPVLVDAIGMYTVFHYAVDNAGNEGWIDASNFMLIDLWPHLLFQNVKKLKGRNLVAYLVCPKDAVGTCTVTYPSKVKPKVKLKGTKKQKKAARKAAKKKFKFSGPKSLAPGETGNLTMIVKKNQCKAFKKKNMKVTVSFTVSISVPDGGSRRVKNSDGAVCGSSSHF